jgi:hypothetical protein
MMTANPAYIPNPQAADGSVTLPAKTADVHGVQLRYEAQPHKDTLGFWTRADDWASWEFQLVKHGRYRVEALQGCGTGQGGSTVEVSVGDQSMTFVVQDTGGFQAFKSREIGLITLSAPGRHSLVVRPKSKTKNAVMDLRAVRLVPAPP